MITATSFKMRFPEFASIDDERIQIFIDDSIVILNETYWGDKYNLGLSYLSAHFLTLSTDSENGSTTIGGPVSSRSVDGASISYAVNATEKQGDSYYMASGYGQRYLALRETLGVPAFAI